jgi:sulfur carrier protein
MIELNGEARPRDGATIVDLLADLGVRDPGARGVAVAVNGEIVPRADWPRRRVADGDRVEALSAMQGG